MSPKPTDGSEQKLRLFIAIPAPTEVREVLQKSQARLKDVLPPGSCTWTKAQNLHLTMRFLGDVPAGRVPEISQRLREVLAGFGEFELRCEQIGCFPPSRFPRVIWAGVHDQSGVGLSDLHRRIENAVGGFADKPAEKEFVGHITLARPKQFSRADAEKLSRFLKGAGASRFGSWRAGAVELIRSELSPQGSHYTTLDVCPL